MQICPKKDFTVGETTDREYSTANMALPQRASDVVMVTHPNVVMVDTSNVVMVTHPNVVITITCCPFVPIE